MTLSAQEALIFLQLPADAGKEEVSDRYEQICFEIKDWALRNTVLPQLFQQRINRLIRLAQAYNAQMHITNPIEAVQATDQSLPITETFSILHHLRGYEAQSVALKLQLSQANNALAIAQALANMVVLQRSYQEGYYHHFKPVLAFGSKLVDEAVKIGQQQDSGTLIRAVLALQEQKVPVDAPTMPAITPEAQPHWRLLLTEAYRIRKWMRLQDK